MWFDQSVENSAATLPCEGVGIPVNEPCDLQDGVLQSFFADTNAMVCVAGFDGYFKRLSPAWEKTLGWSVEELQSYAFIEYVHPNDKAATLEELERLVEGGCTIQFENRYLCKDGGYKWLQWNATSLENQDEVSAVARDISDRRCLENDLINAVEFERERFGMEMHDGLCQHLAGIAALGSTLARNLAISPDQESSKNVQLAHEISTLLNEGAKQAREMARGLAPVSVQKENIDSLLENFARSIKAIFGIDCHYRGLNSDFGMSEEIKFQLFRISQEAIHNAIRHGRGDRILVTLVRYGDRGILSVYDNGEGIGGQSKSGRNGMGVSTMKCRAHLLGGSLKIQPRSRGGTIVSCHFPAVRESQVGAPGALRDLRNSTRIPE